MHFPTRFVHDFAAENQDGLVAGPSGKSGNCILVMRRNGKITRLSTTELKSYQILDCELTESMLLRGVSQRQEVSVAWVAALAEARTCCAVGQARACVPRCLEE